MQLLVKLLLSQKKLQLIRKLLKFNLLPKILTKRILLAKVILLWWSLEQHRLKMVKYPLSQFSQQTLSKTPWSQVGIHLLLGRLIFNFLKFLAYINVYAEICQFYVLLLLTCLVVSIFKNFVHFCLEISLDFFGHERAINIFGHERAINIFDHGRAIIKYF